MLELDVSGIIWRIFMTATMKATVHLGQDYHENLRTSKNTDFEPVKALFEISQSLILKRKSENFRDGQENVVSEAAHGNKEVSEALGPLLHKVCKGSAVVKLKAVVEDRWVQRLDGVGVLVPGQIHGRFHVAADHDDHEPWHGEGPEWHDEQAWPLGHS